MVITVKCSQCAWITDLDTTSATNPSICPKCQGNYVDAYTNQPVEEFPICECCGNEYDPLDEEANEHTCCDACERSLKREEELDSENARMYDWQD